MRVLGCCVWRGAVAVWLRGVFFFFFGGGGVGGGGGGRLGKLE